MDGRVGDVDMLSLTMADGNEIYYFTLVKYLNCHLQGSLQSACMLTPQLRLAPKINDHDRGCERRRRTYII